MEEVLAPRRTLRHVGEIEIVKIAFLFPKLIKAEEKMMLEKKLTRLEAVIGKSQAK